MDLSRNERLCVVAVFHIDVCERLPAALPFRRTGRRLFFAGSGSPSDSTVRIQVLRPQLLCERGMAIAPSR
jgi:hypothetical protein